MPAAPSEARWASHGVPRLLRNPNWNIGYLQGSRLPPAIPCRWKLLLRKVFLNLEVKSEPELTSLSVFTASGRERKSQTGINGPPCPINSDLEAQQTLGSILSGSTSSHGLSVLCLQWTLLPQKVLNMDLFIILHPHKKEVAQFSSIPQQMEMSAPTGQVCSKYPPSPPFLTWRVGYDMCKYLLWWSGEYTANGIHNNFSSSFHYYNYLTKSFARFNC